MVQVQALQVLESEVVLVMEEVQALEEDLELEAVEAMVQVQALQVLESEVVLVMEEDLELEAVEAMVQVQSLQVLESEVVLVMVGLEEGSLAPEVRLLLRVAAVASVVEAKAEVAASQALPASLLPAAVVLGGKVDPPVSPVLQASQLVTANKALST
jgi:hypothetical protein